MKPVKVYPIFYGAWTATQIGIVTTFLSGLGGSAWWNINAQYSDVSGLNTNAMGFGGTYYQYATNTLGTTLTDAQVRVCWHCCAAPTCVGVSVEHGMNACACQQRVRQGCCRRLPE
jgi:hypothetical protein